MIDIKCTAMIAAREAAAMAVDVTDPALAANIRAGNLDKEWQIQMAFNAAKIALRLHLGLEIE